MLLGFCSYVMIWRHPADQANIDFVVTCKTGANLQEGVPSGRLSGAFNKTACPYP